MWEPPESSACGSARPSVNREMADLLAVKDRRETCEAASRGSTAEQDGARPMAAIDDMSSQRFYHWHEGRPEAGGPDRAWL